MVVYCIVYVCYKDVMLIGVGVEKVGGCWNQLGICVVYCFENMLFVLLEYYVYFDNIVLFFKEILVVQIEFLDDFEICVLDKLLECWNQYFYFFKIMMVFFELVKSFDFFVFKVFFIIVGFEFNIIFNLFYCYFGQVKIVGFICLFIDEWFWLGVC